MSITAAINAEPLRIYVVEPQPLLAKAICGVLGQDSTIEIAGSSDDLDPVAIAGCGANLTIIDCDADLSGMARAIARCRTAVPDMRVCVLSAHLSSDLMMRALANGADAYVVKDVRPAELIASMKTIEMHGFYADPRLSNSMLRKRARRDIMQLSRRETEIVQLVAQGLTNKEIGFRLKLSDKTVKNHLSNVFEKLNVTGRAHVVIYAIRNGIV